LAARFLLSIFSQVLLSPILYPALQAILTQLSPSAP
jgi:hypothetical protein